MSSVTDADLQKVVNQSERPSSGLGVVAVVVITVVAIGAICVMFYLVIHPKPTPVPAVCATGSFLEVELANTANWHTVIPALLNDWRKDGTLRATTRNAWLLKDGLDAHQQVVYDAESEKYGVCVCLDPFTDRVTGSGVRCEQSVTKGSCKAVYDDSSHRVGPLPSSQAISWGVAASNPDSASGEQACSCDKGYGWTDIMTRYTCTKLAGGSCTHGPGVQPCSDMGYQNDHQEYSRCCCKNCSIGQGCYDSARNTCSACGNQVVCLPQSAKDVKWVAKKPYVNLVKPDGSDANHTCKCPKGMVLAHPSSNLYEDLSFVKEDLTTWVSWEDGEKGKLMCTPQTGQGTAASSFVPCLRGIDWDSKGRQYRCACNCKSNVSPWSYDNKSETCCYGAQECKGTCLSDKEYESKTAAGQKLYCDTNCSSNRGTEVCQYPFCCSQCVKNPNDKGCDPRGLQAVSHAPGTRGSLRSVERAHSTYSRSVPLSPEASASSTRATSASVTGAAPRLGAGEAHPSS